MQIEELTDFHISVRSENGGDKRKEKDRGNRPTFGRSDKNRENQGPRFLTYTSFNAARGKMMDEALQVKLILALKQLQSLRNGDMSNHSQYYNNFGHTIERCQALKDKIKDFIKPVICASLFRQAPTCTDLRKGKGTLLRTGKNSTYNAGAEDHIVLMMTNIQPNREERVQALYIGLDHGVRVLKGMIDRGAVYGRSST